VLRLRWQLYCCCLQLQLLARYYARFAHAAAGLLLLLQVSRRRQGTTGVASKIRVTQRMFVTQRMRAQLVYFEPFDAQRILMVTLECGFPHIDDLLFVFILFVA
jgi:hypothetical protein